MTIAFKAPRLRKYTPDSRPRKWPVIVCGRQPHKDGSIHNEHKDLVEKALQLYVHLVQSDPAAEERVVMILAGGITKGATSEALLAHRYLQQYALLLGVVLPEVLLEEHSSSTETNITHTKALLAAKGYVVTRLYLLARESQGPKVRDMAVEAWKLALDKIMVVPGLDVALPAYYRWLDARVVPVLLRFRLFRKVWNATRFSRPH